MTEQRAEKRIGLGRFLPNILQKPKPMPIYDPIAEKQALEHHGAREEKKQAETSALDRRLSGLESFLAQQSAVILQKFRDGEKPDGMDVWPGRTTRNEAGDKVIPYVTHWKSHPENDGIVDYNTSDEITLKFDVPKSRKKGSIAVTWFHWKRSEKLRNLIRSKNETELLFQPQESKISFSKKASGPNKEPDTVYRSLINILILDAQSERIVPTDYIVVFENKDNYFSVRSERSIYMQKYTNYRFSPDSGENGTYLRSDTIMTNDMFDPETGYPKEHIKPAMVHGVLDAIIDSIPLAD